MPQEEVFSAVAEEAGRLANADAAQVCRYQPDGSVVRVAAWGAGESLDPADPPKSPAAVSAPIVVDGQAWGLVVVTTTGAERMAEGTERRIAGFTELAATAISNAQARADLAASRTRVVTAADEVRRQIERDLHDGTQQRLVTLALELRGIYDRHPDLPDLRGELAHVSEGLADLLEELREISRGVHPAILSQAGLGPALRTLARRAAGPTRPAGRGSWGCGTGSRPPAAP